MRIAKPLILIATPLGVLGGLYQALDVSPGLALLMVALLCVAGVGIGSVVLAVRQERRAERERAAEKPPE